MYKNKNVSDLNLWKNEEKKSKHIFQRQLKTYAKRTLRGEKDMNESRINDYYTIW